MNERQGAFVSPKKRFFPTLFFVDDNYKGLVDDIVELCAKLRQLKMPVKFEGRIPCALRRSIKWDSI